MSGLPLYCLLALMVAVLCGGMAALFERTTLWGLGFIGASAVAAVLGFLSAYWVTGILAALWTVMAMSRWWSRWQAEREHGST